MTIFTYNMKDFPEKAVNLIVFSGKIIAGDITDTLNGKVLPIEKEE